ncbi:hypothetical protein D3C87_364500 [compost metagenome]
MEKIENKDDITALDEVLSKYEGTLDSIPAQIIITECYDDYFGVYEQSSQGMSPYALVAMHEAEDLALVDPFDVYLERYLVANVLKYTGMSLDTFMKLPRDRAEAVLKRCDNVSTKEDTEVNKLMNGVPGPAGGKKK